MNQQITLQAILAFIKDVAIHLLPPENLKGLIVMYRLAICNLKADREQLVPKRLFH